MYKRYSLQLVTLGLMLLATKFASAAEHQALKKYLADDVVAVACVDLSKIDTLGMLDWAEEIGFRPSEMRSKILPGIMSAQGRMDELVDFGVQYAYVLFRVSDIEHGGPTWVVPVAKSGDPKAVLGLIMRGQARPAGLAEFWEVVDGNLLGGTTAAQLEQMKTSLPESPRDLSDAWSALGQGDCGLVIFGDDDSRRVVREMFPKLPGPFAALSGPLIADGLLWGGISLNLPPKLNLKLVIESQDSEIAASVGQMITEGTAMLKLLALARLQVAEEDSKEFLRAVAPQVEGNRVRIDLDHVTGDVERLTKLLSVPIRAAQQSAQRRTRINHFKNIALGMLNHGYSKRTFPPQASYDENGKPLLSWRVHILPFMEEMPLYKQFHLDEPWDSEHNRKLIAKMPNFYADPDPALHKLNASGRTTYVVPVGEGTVFDRPQGTLIKEVKDGTSNTIMVVEVVPEQAVPWTKPSDWEVDFNDPLDGVRREDRESFSVGWCDGHVRFLSNNIDEGALRAWLTRAGGDAISGQ